MSGLKRGLVAATGAVGAGFIYALIRLFGRRMDPAAMSWLRGPLGGATIGERCYDETAAAEGLTLERHAGEGALLASFDALASASFDPARVDPRIRDFYERTHAYR